MNRRERDIISALFTHRYSTQRELAERCGCSVGFVNQHLKTLRQNGFISEDDNGLVLTGKARAQWEAYRPKRAIILAAGYGMRMIPINRETPKGLLTVKGQPLIERLISQLHEADIRDITVVVGFMKEAYEYLIDAYGVELLVNSEYASKNNLYSLLAAKDRLADSYVLPCDIWCKETPFRKVESYSWYMVSNEKRSDSFVRVNRAQELVVTNKKEQGCRMVGIAYFMAKDAEQIKKSIERYAQAEANDSAFWEEAVFFQGRISLAAHCIADDKVTEINTFEQLRELDASSEHLHSDAIQVIVSAMQVDQMDIREIAVLKKGMTNRSFSFSCRGKRYIMRVPGEGTEKLIDRQKEAQVYQVIAGRGLCDDPIYLDPYSGYKITAFLDEVRSCDASKTEDLIQCMKLLRRFHALKLKVEYEVDLFGMIDFYECLWQGANSVYQDYATTKENVLKLRAYVEKHAEDKVLTHIDAVPDNFLFYTNGQGREEVRLIDWEYAGMQDPHVDIAMFAIYSLYDRAHVDRLIDLYFTGKCPKETRIKIYCYIAACGLLWSNWCEYKRQLGVEFGEYSLRQYRYAKDYYKIVREELDKEKSES